MEEKQQQKYELTITAETVMSTDARFSLDNLGLGDNYMPLDTYFQKASGETIKRNYGKGERKSSNRILPRLACQIFEKQLAGLSIEARANFPICKYNPESDMICGIYSSVDEFSQNCGSTYGRVVYHYGNGRQFVFSYWNIFSTIHFVQECLRRFGEPGDKFVLIYREKDEKEIAEEKKEETAQQEQVEQVKEYRNEYSAMLIESKNLIFRGAPGTGKSHLAREIAADIISNGYHDDYTALTAEQKQQVEFVQFHPSYDYSDFVEGLRPKLNADGTMGFELQDGIFKKFVARARKNYEDSQKSEETVERELSAQEEISDFFSNIQFETDTFQTIKNEFTITDVDEKNIYLSIPRNAIANKCVLKIDKIRKMLEAKTKLDSLSDVKSFFGDTVRMQEHSYYFALYKAIKSKKRTATKATAKKTELKKYIFIIDEINRGEISKIFGELFFAIDPGYRGEAGAVSTQYANLHADPDEKFYIPENVYIIGTMNDIDRSVDSFDFAMRRRFRFVELKAGEQTGMLEGVLDEETKDKAIRKMEALNQEIAQTPDLNENYQIGAAYFLKLKTISFEQLWTDYLQPLLLEYVRGMADEQELMKKFATAYFGEENKNEAAEN